MDKTIYASIWDAAFGGPVVLIHITLINAIEQAKRYGYGARAIELTPDNEVILHWHTNDYAKGSL